MQVESSSPQSQVIRSHTIPSQCHGRPSLEAPCQASWRVTPFHIHTQRRHQRNPTLCMLRMQCSLCHRLTARHPHVQCALFQTLAFDCITHSGMCLWCLRNDHTSFRLVCHFQHRGKQQCLRGIMAHYQPFHTGPPMKPSKSNRMHDVTHGKPLSRH